MAYKDKAKQAATRQAHKEAIGRTIDFNYVMPTGKNHGKTVKDLFLSSIDRAPDDCWHWMGKRFSNGYGCFRSRTVEHLAHRAAFQLFKGREPEGILLHSCDNPACVNPEHLREGTHKENHADAVSRGRARNARGLDSGRGKLSDEDVLTIRMRHERGETCSEIAENYPVPETYIKRIITGDRRADVKENKIMTPQEYSKLALRTMNDMGREKNITHAVLGIADEAGEIAGAYKKHFAYGKTLDNTHIVEELSDLCWFMNLLMHELGYTWEQVFGANIAKLEKRYPDLKFNAGHALNRQMQLELDAINQVL